MTERFQVGAIIKAHGVRGEVKVFPMTDDVNRFRKLSEIIVQKKSGAEQTLGVEAARFFKNTVILKLKGIDTMDEAELYRGSSLFVTRENAVPLSENEYFIADLIDLAVSTDNGEVLGTLTDVLSTGANDVYEVTSDTGKKYLIPAIRDCIMDVNINDGTMTIHPLPGLLDL